MLVTMSDKELSRINVIQSVVEKRMRRRDAAHHACSDRTSDSAFNEPLSRVRCSWLTADVFSLVTGS